MRLADYLRTNGLNDQDFSERIGVSRTTVLRLRRGTCLPRWQTVDRITVATKGLVTAADFQSPSLLRRVRPKVAACRA